MNNKTLKILISFLGIIACLIIFTNISNAASLNISTSKSSVSPGETFTVTVTLNGGAGPITASVSNGSGSATQFLDNGSLSFSCTAGSSGAVAISASGTVGDYVTEQDVPVSASKSVTIVVPTPKPQPSENNSTSGGSSNSGTTTKPVVTKSSNSKLDSLQIAEGVISPEFSSSVKEYNITIPNEITKLSISAIADHSKATIKITGNEDLKVGDNTIKITVTAEDGSKTTYAILANRALPELSLQSLVVSYLEENGTKKELVLDPVFSFDIYDYKIKESLPHTIKELEILAEANRENAKIDVLGNKELKTGKNEITVRVSVTNEAGLEEQKTYKILVEKDEAPVIIEPTTFGKIKTWFSGIGSTISGFISENLNKITTTMLMVATVTFMGLTVYFVYDYKRYNQLLAKLAEYNKENLMERANVALDPEKAVMEQEQNNFEEDNFQTIEENEHIGKAKIKTGKGKRFKE